MSDSHQGSGGGASHESAGHEPIDVSIRWPIVFLGAVAAACVLGCGLVGILMTYYKSEEKALGLSTPAMYKDADGQFPEPRLQRNPPEDMTAFLARERATLASYGWVDKKAGIARIPIDRALELIAERGLPTVAKPPATTDRSKNP